MLDALLWASVMPIHGTAHAVLRTTRATVRVQFMAQKSVPIAPLRHVRTQSDRPFGLSVNRNKVTTRNVRKTLVACPHNRFTTQHATPGLRHKTQHKRRLPVRSTLAWITDKEFTGCPQFFSLFKFPLYCLTHTVSVWPCSPILRSLGLLHLLPLSYP